MVSTIVSARGGNEGIKLDLFYPKTWRWQFLINRKERKACITCVQKSHNLCKKFKGMFGSKALNCQTHGLKERINHSSIIPTVHAPPLLQCPREGGWLKVILYC
jgi:hypothetical protein